MTTAGDISASDFDVTIHWKVPNFFSAIETSSLSEPIRSPSFTLYDSTWFFKMYRNSGNEFVALCLTLESSAIEKTGNYTFCLKKTDGTKFKESTMKNRDFNLSAPCWGCSEFVTLKSLQDEEKDLVQSGTLTVTCRIEESKSSVNAESEELLRVDTLSSDFELLYTNKESCDVCLRVKEKELRAHRAVLMARSSVFAAMFKNDTSEKESGVVNIPDCDPDTFEDFLKYLYNGSMKNISSQKARHLYVTADKYDVQELKKFCVTRMKLKLTVENVCDVVTLADLYEEAELLASCQTFFKRNVKEIIPSAEWFNLMKSDCRLANKMLENMISTIEIVHKEM